MAVKVGTGVLLAAVALVGVLWAPFWVIGPVACLVLLGAQHEFLRLSGGALLRVDLPVALAGGGAILAITALAPWEALSGWMLAGVMIVGMGMLVRVLLTPLRRPEDLPRASQRALWMIGSLLYVPVLGACAVLLLRDSSGEQGRALVLLAGFVTWLNDTLAYFGGKTMGRHRMYPAVSPNKTWEGSVWGMAGSVIGALGVRALLLPEIEPISVILFALTGGALAQAGDLVESVFKRAANVKDSAGFLPGHGGFLDRIDAFLFVLPWTVVWFLIWFPLSRR